MFSINLYQRLTPHSNPENLVLTVESITTFPARRAGPTSPGGVLKHWKISNTKHQIPMKSQSPIFKHRDRF